MPGSEWMDAARDAGYTGAAVQEMASILEQRERERWEAQQAEAHAAMEAEYLATVHAQALERRVRPTRAGDRCVCGHGPVLHVPGIAPYACVGRGCTCRGWQLGSTWEQRLLAQVRMPQLWQDEGDQA